MIFEYITENKIKLTSKDTGESKIIDMFTTAPYEPEEIIKMISLIYLMGITLFVIIGFMFIAIVLALMLVITNISVNSILNDKVIKEMVFDKENLILNINSTLGEDKLDFFHKKPKIITNKTQIIFEYRNGEKKKFMLEKKEAREVFMDELKKSISLRFI